MEHDEKKLPKWAQERIEDLKHEIERLQALKRLHALLVDPDREWFTISNIVRENRDYNTLWLLDSDQPHSVCALGKNDLLFIGRALK